VEEKVKYPECFYKIISVDLDDFLTRKVMADWYEENGDLGRAEAIRWQCQEGIRPYRQKGSSPVLGLFDRYFYDKSTYDEDRLSNVPSEVYRLISKIHKEPGCQYKAYWRGNQLWRVLMRVEQALQNAYMEYRRRLAADQKTIRKAIKTDLL
jgi:uncharacterized protein (TIGR02996 family)